MKELRFYIHTAIRELDETEFRMLGSTLKDAATMSCHMSAVIHAILSTKGLSCTRGKNQSVEDQIVQQLCREMPGTPFNFRWSPVSNEDQTTMSRRPQHPKEVHRARTQSFVVSDGGRKIPKF